MNNPENYNPTFASSLKKNMLQSNLTRRVEHALLALDTAEPLLKIINTLNSVNHHIDTNVLGIASDNGNKFGELASALHTQFSSLSGLTKELSARQLFRDIEKLEISLRTSLAEGLDDAEFIIRTYAKRVKISHCEILGIMRAPSEPMDFAALGANNLTTFHA